MESLFAAGGCSCSSVLSAESKDYALEHQNITPQGVILSVILKSVIQTCE